MPERAGQVLPQQVLQLVDDGKEPAAKSAAGIPISAPRRTRRR
jgi:hypothetical protein